MKHIAKHLSWFVVIATIALLFLFLFVVLCASGSPVRYGAAWRSLDGQVLYEPYIVYEQKDIVRNISANWLKTDKSGDHNFDGYCDFIDYAILLNRWGDNE